MIFLNISKSKWYEQGIARYGFDVNKWRYICPKCKKIQICDNDYPYFGLTCIYPDCGHSHFNNDNPIYIKLSDNTYRNSMDFDISLIPGM